MLGSKLQIAIALGSFVGLAAISPAFAQAPAPAPKVCSAKGPPANAGAAPPWTITVSNEGVWCGHRRTPATRANNITFQVRKAPQHGEVSQAASGPQTTISYKPVKGYVGADSFTLYLPNGNIEYQYQVNVTP